MYVENRFTSGDCVMPLPIGVPIKVEYNNKGLLHKVVAFTDYTFKQEVEANYFKSSNIHLYDTFVKAKTVPLDILIKNGSTYVLGVLRSNSPLSEFARKVEKNVGLIPTCFMQTVLEDFCSDPYNYTFVATDITSDAQKFTTAVVTKQWLSTAGFTVSKSLLVPSGITESQFIQLIHSNNLEQDCTYPVICGYTIFNKNSISHIAILLELEHVSKEPKITFNDDGDVLLDVVVKYSSSKSKIHSYPYTQCSKLNIHKGSTIVTDPDTEYVYFASFSDKKYSDAISCPLCHAKVVIGRDIHHNTKCSNPHCPSNTYAGTIQMCDDFGLPSPEKDKYYSWGRNIVNLAPADYLNTFPDTYVIKTSLASVLRAAIPTKILPSDASISELLHKCNDSQETVIFYIRNSERMLTDLGLNQGMYNRFLKWLKVHDEDVVKMIENPHIQIESSKHLSSVDPTLRTKNIFLTGQFKRGSYSEISEILESYAATIVTQVSLANTVITGSLLDGVDGQAIKYARQHDISVVDEDTFFTSYLIDEDLTNLS